jgi:Leucine-rich repeat (LRR) protein
LSSNSIGDVTALGSLTTLKELGLASNSLTSVEALASLLELTSLNFSANQVATLAPLVSEAMFGLRGGQLNITGNPLPCATQQSNIDKLEKRGLSIVGTCE